MVKNRDQVYISVFQRKQRLTSLLLNNHQMKKKRIILILKSLYMMTMIAMVMALF